MMLPSPCLTVISVLLGLNVSPWLLQMQSFSLWQKQPKTQFDCHVSLHDFWFSLRASANFNCSWRCRLQREGFCIDRLPLIPSTCKTAFTVSSDIRNCASGFLDGFWTSQTIVFHGLFIRWLKLKHVRLFCCQWHCYIRCSKLPSNTFFKL